MTLLVLAYLGGVLTILSPCILPVLPFVFARAGQSFHRSGLPMLIGMAITFALVATLAAVGGAWAVQANQYGRYVALLILALFGLSLLLPRLADRLMQPLVAIGSRISTRAENGGGASSALSSVLLGIGTGLLWAPCAGPILGLVLTGAALHGANVGTFGLLLAYAAGAATSLAAALLIGGRLSAALKRSLGAGEWLRRGLGVAVLAAVVAIALGLDTGWLARVSTASTNGIEQSLLAAMGSSARGGSPSPSPAIAPEGSNAMMMKAKPTAVADRAAAAPPVEGVMPPLDGAVEWLNSPPLSAAALRGKVVLIDFWTYSCVNCLRTLPYVRAWYDKYKDQGLVVIGVHAPEFAFEKDIGNVRRAVKDLGVDYPVAIDNNYAIWRAFDNEYWPAHYFIDAQGRIRHHHFGEGEYAESEQVIQALLAEAGAQHVAAGTVQPDAGGAALAAADAELQSPETYIGYGRAENFASPGGAGRDARRDYRIPAELSTNEWALAGTWNVGEEKATLTQARGRIAFRFHARDVNLVLGPGADGRPVRYKVTVDGKAPEDDRGSDTNADGSGEVTEQRMYQLVRIKGEIADRTFEIEFVDPGVEAFAFTFG